MLAVFYLALFVFAFIILFLAVREESFPFAYLGMGLIMFIGLMLWSHGVEMPNGSLVNASTDLIVQTTTYENHTYAGNWIVAAFANIFFYGGFGLMLGTTFFALRS